MALSDRIAKLVRRRGGDEVKLDKNTKVDPVIFWFEFMDWMVHNKNPKFMTIIFDEADELFPQSPGGVRWHLNLWAKDIIKIFVVVECHYLWQVTDIKISMAVLNQRFNIKFG